METKKLDLYTAENLYIGDKQAIRAYNNNQLIYGASPEPYEPDYSKFYFTIRLSREGQQSGSLQYRWNVQGRQPYPFSPGYITAQCYNQIMERDDYGWKWAEDSDISFYPNHFNIQQNEYYTLNEPNLCVRMSSNNCRFGYMETYDDKWIESYIILYSGVVYIYGNLLSLVYSENFRNYTTCSDYYKQYFKGMLNPSYSYNLTNLIVPTGWNKEAIIGGHGDL